MNRCTLQLCCLAALGIACSKTDKPAFAMADFNSDPTPPGPLRGMFIATDNGSDLLSAVDPVSRTVKWSIPVGFIPVELEGPHHATADPSGQFVYVNLSEAVVGSGSGPHGSHGTGIIPGFVLKIRTSDASQVAFAQVDPNPGDLVITPDGKTLYVTHYDLVKLGKGVQAGDLRQGDSNLAVIDTALMTVTRKVPICPAAHGVRLSADSRTLYATCLTDEIAVVDVSDPNLPVQRVLLPNSSETPSCSHCPYALSVAPDGAVWVSSLGPGGGTTGGGSVNVYDPPAKAFDPARTVNFCGRTLFSAFAAAPGGAPGYLVYVPEQGGGCGDSVRVFGSGGPGQAPSTAGVIHFTRAECLNAHILNLSADGKTGYLVCEGDHVGPGSFAFLDLQTLTTTASVPLGVFPDGMVLVP
jgi:hypothetical protein